MDGQDTQFSPQPPFRVNADRTSVFAKPGSGMRTMEYRPGEDKVGPPRTMEYRPGRDDVGQRVTLEQRMLTEDDLPNFVNDIVRRADEDKTMYAPNPSVPRRPSFMQAVKGIENGDYEGLEMFEFGAVADGTPAVAFTDEDGQRQVIRLTVPQWFGALESRSRARQQFKQVQDLIARKQAFAPYFDAMAKKVGEYSDPEINAYLTMMYEFDPQMAINQLGSFMKNKDARTMWHGKAVPAEFAQTAQQMYTVMYDGKMRQYDAMSKGLQDKPYGLAMLEGVRALNRSPADVLQPQATTVIDNLRGQGGGVMPLVNLMQAMQVPGMLPFLPSPVQIPRPTQDGQYNPDEIMSFLDTFNMVSENLGWGPVLAVDEPGLATMVDALNIANKTDGILPRLPASQVVEPASVQTAKMRQQERAGMAPSAPGQPAGGGDEAIMSGARALGMEGANPEQIVDRILTIEQAIKDREYTGDWSQFPYDPAQRQAILGAAQALRQLQGQE